MKLASLKHGRDGRLIVVSRDLTRAADATGVAPTLQAALERWESVVGALQTLSDELNAGRAAGAFAFDPVQAAAPMPRSYQWLDGSAFTAHGDLMSQAFRIAENPQRPGVPLMYQGGSDDFLGPCDDAPFPNQEDGIDFEGEYCVILADTPMGVTRAEAPKYVRLLMLANDWSLRRLAPVEMKTGFGWVQAKPSTSFSPVAVTPDELGDAWRDGRVHLEMHVSWNGKRFGAPNGGAMTFDFHHLVEHAGATRRLRAGTIIGSGTVSEGAPDKVGSACIAEQRGFETLHQGEPKTPFMKFGDRARIEVRNGANESIFGALDQQVVRANV
jgi:fumarylacetoacetate (FAA) hydrolase